MVCLLTVLVLNIWWSDLDHRYHSCGTCEEAREIFIKEYHVPEPHIKCIPIYEERAYVALTIVIDHQAPTDVPTR